MTEQDPDTLDGGHQGVCSGGPLDGQALASRFPQGFLLVDKPNGCCWLYDWTGDRFKARSEEPMPVQDGPADGPGDSRYRAAAEPFYDVLAAPWVGADDEGAADGD
ncbi:hypothetical protein AB0A95_30540 [Micromonospora sp. NPDC049230]|uniref:hypothetical protein n=1 Tax=Micromonospora sp. NPDC049230 TaxID=3155502 RepID=UPI0033C1E818